MIIITNEERLEMINKKAFVDRIAYAIVGQHRIGVIKIEYKVFAHEEYGIAEYIVVTYHGGAIAPRNVRGNSNSANYREIGELLDGGYYSEVEHYREIEKDPAWAEVDLGKEEK